MVNIIKSLPGLENGSIQFNRINTSPEEYTNVHSVLFNGDQEGFEITSDSSGGFTKLVDSITIDWQAAQMPNTAQLLGFANGISLNDTAQLIDIIERISAKLNNGGIPEPTEPTIVSISAESTDINIDYLTTFTPVIKATYTNAEIHTLDNSLFTWTIGDSTIISQDTNNVVKGIKANDLAVTLHAELTEDPTKSITFNIKVNKVDINRVEYSGISAQQITWDYDNTPVTLSNIKLKWQTETLVKDTDYTLEYQNNIGNIEQNVTAIINFTGTGNNYYGTSEKTFNIKAPAKENPTMSWSESTSTVTIGEQNTFPILSYSPNTLSITYSSINTNIATIDANGEITLIAEGTTTIKATSEETTRYNSKTVQYNLTVNESEVIPEYYWYCGTNVVDNGDGTYTLPEINDNNIIDDSTDYDNSGFELGLPGWRYIDSSKTYEGQSNALWQPNMVPGQGIYLDGYDDSDFPLFENVVYYVALPKTFGFGIYDGLGNNYSIATIINNSIMYNNIEYVLYSLEYSTFTGYIYKK